MQNRRALLFFAFAILFGVAAAFTAHRVLERQVTAPAPVAIQTVPVVIARADLPTGGILSTPQLATVEWPAEFSPTGSFAQASDLEGRALRRALAAGEPVLEPSLLPEGSAGSIRQISASKHPE